MNLDQTIRILKDRAFLESLALGVVAIFVSLVSVYYSSAFATENSSNSVNDIILSNTRVYDVGTIFVYGAIAAVIFSILVVFSLKLRSAPFILKSASFLLIVRSVFVSLTHISPYPARAVLADSYLYSPTVAQMFFTGHDLFFSGHVGLTFLMALLLWDTPKLRYIYLAISAVFAVVVLLGHLHYSIDVLGAYFITYSVYMLSMRIFRKDYERSLA